MSQQQSGTLRAVMPVAAELVDWLRDQFGKEYADKLVLKGKRGDGGFYVAEIGPDGQFREFGSTKSGKRCVCESGRVVWQPEGDRTNGAN